MQAVFGVDADPAEGGTGGFPLKPGSPAELIRLCTMLREIDYTERGICIRSGSTSMAEYRSRGRVVSTDALEVCIQLFMEAEPVAQSLVHQLLPDDGPALLVELGLLHVDAADPEQYRAPLSLYPLGGLYLVSDHTAVVVGRDGIEPPDDVVYPAIQATTIEFLSAMPRTSCERLLDIGAGTGVAALLAARNFAQHAWAVDIADRSTRTCEFNARLNQVENVTAFTGDLFEPVAGLTFDRIVAHPPYMPAGQTRLIFRDAGADGEELVRRIIQSLPQYLRPGGRFYCRTMATDRAGAALEQRVRAWLGEGDHEFDIVLVTNQVMRPAEFYVRRRIREVITSAQLEEQLRVFDELAIENMVVGFISIERHARSQDALTIRRSVGQRAAPPTQAVDWVLAWERAAADPDFEHRLRAARPSLAEQVQIRLSHGMRTGRFRAEKCIAETEHPFHYIFESTPGIALLLSACDGTRTVNELRDFLAQQGALPAETTMEEFLGILRMLIGGGIVEVEEFRLPPE